MNPLSTTLGDLARAHPSATRVFLRHRLDFCCGGRQTLAEACEAAGLNPAEVAEELTRAATSADDATSWEYRPLDELADYIEEHYHFAFRRDVPPLIEAARKVERVHEGKPAVPAGLAASLQSMYEEMDLHMTKEERVLFPRIRVGGRGAAVAMPIQMMELEHENHRDHLLEIRGLTGNFVAPSHACATWRALYQGLEAMEADLMRHIHLENHVLFARAGGR